MTTSALAKLKAGRMNFADLAAKVENQISPAKEKRQNDERFYYPATDENKNGEAVLRFLPGLDPTKPEFVTVYSHGYEGINGWYIHECPTTLGIKTVKCPQCMANQAVYKQYGGYESTPKHIKDEIRPRNRRTQFITNVLVVSDPANPENEGKVFLFRFGKKIMDQLKEAIKPSFASKTPCYPWSIFDDGANWNMRIKRVDDNANYESSEFDQCSELKGTEDELNAILESQYSLDEFVAPEKFESFEVLQAAVNDVMGVAPSPTEAIASSAPAAQAAAPGATTAPTTQATSAATTEAQAPTTAPSLAENDAAEDEALSYFDDILKGKD